MYKENVNVQKKLKYEYSFLAQMPNTLDNYGRGDILSGMKCLMYGKMTSVH